MNAAPVRLLCVISLAASGHLVAQRPPLTLIGKRLDSVVTAFAQRGDFSGVVLVAEHGRPVYQRAIGLAVREWRVPMTTDAVFRIGSTTKQFTAALILTLVEEGKIRLDAYVSDYLPGYPVRTGSRVTIRQLLTHSSGIPDYVSRDSFFIKHAPAPAAPADLIARFAALPLEFDPGTQWSYSNSNYLLLGSIIERVSGTSYASLLQSRIARPLHMSSLAVDDGAMISHRPLAYFNFGGEVTAEAHVDPSSAFGAGTLRVNAADLLKWDEALYNGRIFRDTSLVREMYQPRIATGTPLGHYGYGLFNGSQMLGGHAVTVIQHGGTISGFLTGFWRMPEQHRTVIVLSNLRSEHTSELTGALASALYR